MMGRMTAGGLARTDGNMDGSCGWRRRENCRKPFWGQWHRLSTWDWSGGQEKKELRAGVASLGDW
jgi:hypothetical protein